MIDRLSKRAAKLNMQLLTYIVLFENGWNGRKASTSLCPMEKRAFKDGVRFRKKNLTKEQG